MKPSQNRSNRNRYGSLRPLSAQVLEWCAQGDDWKLIQGRLAELGATVNMGTLWGYAQRHGWLLIHPYSQHYDPVIAYQFSKGEITVEDLRRKNKENQKLEKP